MPREKSDKMIADGANRSPHVDQESSSPGDQGRSVGTPSIPAPPRDERETGSAKDPSEDQRSDREIPVYDHGMHHLLHFAEYFCRVHIQEQKERLKPLSD